MNIASTYLSRLVRGWILLQIISLSVSAEPSVEVTVRIATDEKPIGEVTPKLFGGFVEHMHTCVEGGLWGEVLADRKFADAAAPNAPLGRFWKAIGNPANIVRTNNTIMLTPNGDAVGIEQTDLYGTLGKSYRGTAYINTESFRGEIEFAMFHGQKEILSDKVRVPSVKGRFSTGQITAPSNNVPITMRMIARGTGTFIIGAPSVVPTSTTAGVQPAVLPLLKKLSPSWLRWPGGNFAQTYHWRDGIGPKDSRPPRLNMAWPKGPVESNDFGTEEFISLCRALQAEPVICVNVNGNGATVEEAAEWVAYCKRRGLKVRYWEIGNEIYGKWEVGHTDAATYAQNFLRYAAAMKAVDKNIRLIAVGHTLEWDREVLRRAGPSIDYLSQHLYTNKPQFPALMQETTRYEQFLGNLRKLVKAECPERDIRVTVNEWNVGDHGFHQWTLAAALFGAGIVHGLARADGFVDFACASDLINGWPGGTIQSARGGALLTPLGEVLTAYRSRLPGKRISVTCSAPSLDIVATRNQYASHYTVAVLNRDPARSYSLSFDFGKWRPARAEEWQLAGASLEEKRDFEHPFALSPGTQKIGKEVQNCRVILPAHSATIMTFTR